MWLENEARMYTLEFQVNIASDSVFKREVIATK